jgi:Rrf2 family nitric oxide-sensitive transcriptional repressor
VQCFQPRDSGCSIESVCVLRGVLERAMGAFFEVLDGQTLADLLKPRAQLIGIFRGAGTRS